MMPNLERYKKDLESLIATGEQLANSIQAECYPEEFESAAKTTLGSKTRAFIAALPPFAQVYQRWYSEAMVLIRQLLPDRLADFTNHYNRPRSRKEITFESYRIADYLQGLRVTRGWQEETVVRPAAAIPHFQQQLAILQAVEARFESSLFDIRQLTMADLFDSELGAARELAKKGFLRAAGAVTGVVLEKHLRQVCSNHGVAIRKKNATIGDMNNLLKEADAVGIPQWRFIQHLGDVRNLCDHNKQEEPTSEQVSDLITGVDKTLKTLF